VKQPVAPPGPPPSSVVRQKVQDAMKRDQDKDKAAPKQDRRTSAKGKTMMPSFFQRLMSPVPAAQPLPAPSVKFCPGCGKQRDLKRSVRFCEECGYNFESI